MVRFVKKTSQKAGLSPGALVHVGEEQTEKARITIIDYDVTQFHELQAESCEECYAFKDTKTITWINVDGIHQVEVIERIGTHFGIHPLVLEDIVNTEHRPKVEEYEEYIFIVMKMLYYDEQRGEIISRQISIVLGSNFAISFQESKGDVFEPVRKRIRDGKGRIRKMDADYLAYALIDAIVDNYFTILEKIGERLEGIEEELLTEPKIETLQNIHELKREMIYLRKSVWPLREVVSTMGRGESPLVGESMGIFLKDVYDHTIHVIDTVETYRDVLSGMLDLYLSSISNRMNEVMKVLTIIATIFIPLTFIAGIYGMNFLYMPELEWHWSYPLVLIVMVAIGILMLSYFRRKRWL